MYSVGTAGHDNVITSFIQSFPALSRREESDRPLTAAYGYTAGAWYRKFSSSSIDTNVDRLQGNYPASLSLGSIVPSRIQGSAITVGLDFFRIFPDETGFSTAYEDVLAVGLWSFSASGTLNDSGGNLRSNYLDHGIWVALDPELPYLELPEEVCHRVAHDFELDFDNSTSLFTVSESTRARLRRLRPSFRVTVGSSLVHTGYERPLIDPTSQLDIVLPYEAFEHNMQYDSGQIVPYFPIRIAAESQTYTRYVLGRVFFQEA